MTLEIIRRDLSPKQRKDLIEIVNGSKLFKVGEDGFVCVTDIKNGHPSTRMGPRPLGLITGDRASLLNTDLYFPEDYHGKLKELYRSV